MQAPTLDEIKSQLEAQDAEIARLARLAESLPSGLTVPQAVLEELDAATEHASSVTTLHAFALRA